MGVIDRAILQDEIRQALNGLFLNGQVGRVRTERIAYNSETDTKEIILYGKQPYARVLDEPISLTADNFNRVVITVSVSTESGTMEYSKADGTAFVERVAEMGGANCVFTIYDGDTTDLPVIAVFEQDLPAELTGVAIKKGVYFISETEPEAKAEITLEYETIHPIDQKFLPGVCLPVVELETPAVNETALSDADNTKLREVIASGMPIVCKFVVEGATFSTVFANAAGFSASAFFAGSNFFLTYVNEDDGWRWDVQ